MCLGQLHARIVVTIFLLIVLIHVHDVMLVYQVI